MNMKNIIVFLCLLTSNLIFSQSLKQAWSYAELINAEGETIHKWESETHSEIITQRVCKKQFLVINSEDPKILQMISPSAVFDMSTIRTFEQYGSVEQADRDSIDVVYKLNFKSLHYPDKFLLFTDSANSFLMLMPNPDIALVLHNGKK